MKGRDIWELPIFVDSSWTWKKMLKLRPVVESMVTRHNDVVQWVFKNQKYSSTDVWNFTREKKRKVPWRNMIWGTIVLCQSILLSV